MECFWIKTSTNPVQVFVEKNVRIEINSEKKSIHRLKMLALCCAIFFSEFQLHYIELSSQQYFLFEWRWLQRLSVTLFNIFYQNVFTLIIQFLPEPAPRLVFVNVNPGSRHPISRNWQNFTDKPNFVPFAILSDEYFSPHSPHSTRKIVILTLFHRNHRNSYVFWQFVVFTYRPGTKA